MRIRELFYAKKEKFLRREPHSRSSGEACGAGNGGEIPLFPEISPLPLKNTTPIARKHIDDIYFAYYYSRYTLRRKGASR
jgi:hypothetical protein